LTSHKLQPSLGICIHSQVHKRDNCVAISSAQLSVYLKITDIVLEQYSSYTSAVVGVISCRAATMKQQLYWGVRTRSMLIGCD